ncbi:MAG: lytic transglycosylase domain-containing protein [Candidatus Puniceispirillales bacterium]|jgi:hypothetical protein
MPMSYPFHLLHRFHWIIALMGIMMSLVLSTSQASASGYDNSDQIKIMIIQEALKSRYVSPSLALAVAETESSFRPHVVSHKGAIGVMQIMPATARGVFSVDPQRLYQPRLNIQLGIRFLDDLILQYDGRFDLALSHYNGGSRVTHTQPPSIIPSTRGYVMKVLNRAQHYQAIWRDMLDHPVKSQPQLVMLPVTTTTHDRHAIPLPDQWNGHYHWQREIRDINYWLSQKNAEPMGIYRPQQKSYSQKLVTRMQKNRARVSQWISENS